LRAARRRRRKSWSSSRRRHRRAAPLVLLLGCLAPAGTLRAELIAAEDFECNVAVIRDCRSGVGWADGWTGANRITAAFVLVRGTDRGRPIVELRLAKGDFKVCPKRRGLATAATIVRQVWGTGKGRFRTRGRYASATVRGTRWLTADRCDGTQTRVTQGVVQVNDLPRNRQVTLRAGGSYLARQP